MKPSLEKILDYSTRSWFAFWWTVVFSLGYALWNVISGYDFDPYPFIFLTLLLTFFSYLQNIIIMTVQKENETIQKKQTLYLLHLMEVVAAQVALLQPVAEHVTAKPTIKE